MTANAFQPKHLAYKARVEESFRKQGVMATLGASLQLIEPGVVDIALDWAEGLTQQHGFLHAGVVATALDSACGYAGLTLMPEDAAVLTIEFRLICWRLLPESAFAWRGVCSNRDARSLCAKVAPLPCKASKKSWSPRWPAP